MNSPYLSEIKLKRFNRIFDSFEIDPNIPLKSQKLLLQEDLIQINYPKNYTIDVGWYPSIDTKGAFRIFVIHESNWEKPLYDKRCKSINEMKLYLQEAIDLADSLSHEKI